MSTQSQAADDLESAARDLDAFIAGCSDDVWRRTVGSDGRTVGALAFHAAAGSDVALGWICQILSGRPVHENGDMHDAVNNAEAERSASRTQSEVRAQLQRSTGRVAYFLRTLTDEELERSALHGIAERDVSVGRFIANFGRHMRGHLDSMRAVTLKTDETRRP